MASMYDYFRAILLIGIFVAALFRGPRTWIKIDSFITLLSGSTLFIYPSLMLTQVTTSAKPDGLHSLLQRTEVLVYMMPGMVYVLCNASRDKMLFGSILWSRVVSCGMVLYVTSTAHFHDPKKFNDTHLYYVVLACGVWLAINAWQLFRYWDHARGSFHLNPVNGVLILDAILTLMGFVTDFCFTSSALGMQTMKTDYFHGYLLRMTVAVNLGSVVLMVLGIWYAHLEDKRAIFKSRLAIGAVYLLCLVVGKMLGQMALTWKDFAFFSLGGIHPTLLGAVGLYLSRPGHKYSSERGRYNLRDRKD